MNNAATARRWRGVSLVLACVAPLSGCSLSSLGVGDVDRSAVTSNVPQATNSDPQRSSDEMTIRNAVSSADLGAAGVKPLAWANADTGSRGAITGVVQTQESGTVCRKFTATREAFDGVGLYSGKACMIAPGAWNLTAFAPY